MNRKTHATMYSGNRGHRRAARILASGVLAGVAVVTAGHAHAGEQCTRDPTGTIELCSRTTNQTNGSVDVAKNWCGDDRNGGPCSGSDNFAVLNPGSTTPDHQDWDAFFVPRNCSYSGTIDRRLQTDIPFFVGESFDGIWIHVHDDERYVIQQITCHDPPPQKLGRIKVLSSNMCLVARAGWGERPVVQVPCAGFSDQVWIIQYLAGGNGPEGLAQIKNRDRDLCLVTRGQGESLAVVSTCSVAWPDQIWNIVRDPGTGYYQFVNQNSNLCLVVRTSTSETQAVQSTCGRQWADQLWLWEGWFQ